MRGEWKGLQALFLNDCPCAYYVHCFAHRLQLALVSLSMLLVLHVNVMMNYKLLKQQKLHIC